MTSMLQIQWQDKYQIDRGTIDDEHKSLLDLANRTFALIDPRARLSEVIELVQQLFRYVDVHFEHEEALMMQANYPGLIDHMQKHRKLSEQLTAAIRSQNDIEKIQQLLQHIMLDWVIRHILTEDMRFGQYVKRTEAIETQSPTLSA
jgi:hemerythrin